MEQPLISVIIPVYQTERYLDRCVQSVVNQTYEKIEIILIDDGSKDCCPQMCNEWGKKDNRVKVIHKSNGGLSSARNIALDICKGMYIIFVDSDDWIEPETINELYCACIENNSLMSVSGRYIVSGDKRYLDKCFDKTKVLDPILFVQYMLLGKNCDCVAWGKMYHRYLWDEIRFPFGKIYEDIAIMYKIVLKANSITTVAKPLYNFYRHENSITSSAFNYKQFDYTNNTREMLDDIRNNHVALYEYACFAHIEAIQCILGKLAKSDKTTYKFFREKFYKLSKELFSYRTIWLRSKLFTNKKKMFCLFFSMGCAIRPIYMLLKFLKG